MKNKKPTIVILTPGFAANEIDSTCLPALQNFIKALKENFPGLNIIILSFQYPFFKGTYKWNGIDVISLNGKNRRKLFKLLLWQKAMSQLRKINKENNVIGLLSFWCGECAWIGKRFSKKNHLKHFCWLWGQDAREGNKFVKWMRPSGNELIALSDSLQNEFEKNYSIKPAYVIPSGINTAEYKSMNSQRDIDILGAGSLILLKQYNFFIEIINELKTEYPYIRAIISGKGPEEINLQKQIQAFDLQNNITLTGEISHSEILQLMQRSKIFLHPSSYEGFSGVCQEALYAGAQVVSFRRAMNHEIKHWHIVNTKEEMKKKCLDILGSPISFESVITYEASQTADSIMKLFNYKEEMTL